MANKDIEKISIFFSNEKRDTVLNLLQKEAIVDIHNITTEDINEDDMNIIYEEKNNVDLKISQCDFLIEEIEKYENKKGSLFETKKIINKENFTKIKKNFDIEKIIDSYQDILSQENEIKNKIKKLEEEKNLLLPWNKVEFGSSETNTKNILSETFLIKKMEWNEFKNHSSSNKKLSEAIKLGEDAEHIAFIIIYHKSFAQNVYREVLTSFELKKIDFKNNISPKLELENIVKKLKEDKKKLNELKNEKLKYCKYKKEAEVLFDYFNWKKDKIEAKAKITNTGNNSIISVFIAKENITYLKERLSFITDDCFYVEIEELAADKEKPVLIKNTSLFSPFESVTKIYGLPLSKEIDPTVALAPFFILFFALCLTDAGYGILMFVLFFLAIKFLKLKGESLKLPKLLMFGGIVTIIIGTIFGGWFGIDATETFATFSDESKTKIISHPAFLTKIVELENGKEVLFFRGQFINSILDPLKVLVLAFSLGYIQTFVGILIAFFDNLKKDKLSSFLDHGIWLLLFINFAIYIFSMTISSLSFLSYPIVIILKINLLFLIIAKIIPVFREKSDENIVVRFIKSIFSGFLNLYNIMGYTSDILSYSRLLALGLATGIIAMSINIVAEIVYDQIPYIGFLVAFLVLLVGHSANLAINALGAFIHSGRLQFVEFFKNFMEGGGIEFKFFDRKSKYIEIKKD